ncbi:hypothetical protein M5K25_001413 [Dendrobium thyrsiflorum]|uniref:DUF4283 domain-containing protein n=1 Tax=Dendrobium thyrsiflorum TaxID=117978 RepID=A0ABD0VQB6_DENTH
MYEEQSWGNPKLFINKSRETKQQLTMRFVAVRSSFISNQCEMQMSLTQINTSEMRTRSFSSREKARVFSAVVVCPLVCVIMAVNRLDDPGFLENNFKSRSFCDALSGVSSLSDFPELKLSSRHGLPALWISDEKMRALAVPFEFALVGKFPGRRPSLEAIQKFFFLLKLSGKFSVTLLNSKNILVKFTNDLDYCRVFSHRSYFVGNCYMRLVKWSPLLDIDIESPTIPIWYLSPTFGHTYLLPIFYLVWAPYLRDR